MVVLSDLEELKVVEVEKLSFAAVDYIVVELVVESVELEDYFLDIIAFVELVDYIFVD